jgi:trans-AT polyketide synthase/acyltransferase/oxidoreductase domain-containing protein
MYRAKLRRRATGGKQPEIVQRLKNPADANDWRDGLMWLKCAGSKNNIIWSQYMSIAVIFPGQGSQSIGMGAELFDKFPELCAAADAALGWSVKDLCLNGPKEKLDQTCYTQPCLYVVSALAWLDRVNSGAEAPAYLAGHSLGEYNALFAAGAFDFITGLKLVARRGEIMFKVEGGGMAAVLGMSAEKVEEVMKSTGLASLDVANFNSPLQTVISGKKDDIIAAEPAFKAAAAKRYVVLPVSGAFHSREMSSSQEEFTTFARQFVFNPPGTPVLANFTARPYDGKAILNSLCSQISGSVRWTESVRWMHQQGVTEFVEVGPGKVLSGLVKQITG